MITTIEELDSQITKWAKDGFNGATWGGNEPGYRGSVVRRYGVDHKGRLFFPCSSSEPHVAYRVERERYTAPFAGTMDARIVRLLDDGTGKTEYVHVDISNELGDELTRRHRNARDNVKMSATAEGGKNA